MDIAHSLSEAVVVTQKQVKTSARDRVKYLTRIGKLPRAPQCKCEHCGRQAQYYHHRSFSLDRLDVIPLCGPCLRKATSRTITYVDPPWTADQNGLRCPDCRELFDCDSAFVDHFLDTYCLPYYRGYQCTACRRWFAGTGLEAEEWQEVTFFCSCRCRHRWKRMCELGDRQCAYRGCRIPIPRDAPAHRRYCSASCRQLAYLYRQSCQLNATG